MKILYVGHTYSIKANQGKLLALASQKNIDLHLITPESWKGALYEHKADILTGPNITHHALRTIFKGKEGGYVYLGGIKRIVQDLQPDILHVEQGAYAMSYAQLLLACKKYSPATRATFFTWWNLPYKPQGLKAFFQGFNLKHSSCAITGNAAAKEVLKAQGFQRPIWVMPQIGVDLKDFSEHSYTDQPDAPFVIGYVGRIAEEKGVLDLAKAIGKLDSAKVVFRVVGKGDALEDLFKLAKELRLNLQYSEAIRNEEVPAVLKELDVLVLPSRTVPTWMEQFGHILIEAMAAKVAVVGSDSGEIPNVVGSAGVIFPEGNWESLADILSEMQSNRGRTAEIAAHGYKRVIENYTNEKLAQRQLEVYNWMLNEGTTVGNLVLKA